MISESENLNRQAVIEQHYQTNTPAYSRALPNPADAGESIDGNAWGH